MRESGPKRLKDDLSKRLGPKHNQLFLAAFAARFSFMVFAGAFLTAFFLSIPFDMVLFLLWWLLHSACCQATNPGVWLNRRAPREDSRVG